MNSIHSALRICALILFVYVTLALKTKESVILYVENSIVH